MITTIHYKLVGYRITMTKPVSCPHCGYVTMIYDYRDRKTKDSHKRVTWYRTPRIICERCKRVSTVLPYFIRPFKQIVRDNSPSFYEKIGGYYGNLQ